MDESEAELREWLVVQRLEIARERQGFRETMDLKLDGIYQ